MKVRDVMTRGVVSVTRDTPLREVACVLSEHRISGVPVVDPDGACVGIVSEADVLAKQVSRPPSRRTPIEWIFGERHDPTALRRRGATIAGEAMSAPPITIEEDRPLRDAAARMVDAEVNRLPVVSDGRLVGIVTRADLVRAYLRVDEEVLESVREGVLRRTMWLDPGAFEVAVHEGMVRIAGTVDRRSTARIIERLIGVVDGVTEIQSGLAWELDDTRIDPGAAMPGEPGAASVLARQRPQPLHR